MNESVRQSLETRARKLGMTLGVNSDGEYFLKAYENVVTVTFIEGKGGKPTTNAARRVSEELDDLEAALENGSLWKLYAVVQRLMDVRIAERIGATELLEKYKALLDEEYAKIVPGLAIHVGV